MNAPFAPSRAEIARFLRPRSIAIVGASDKKGALGNNVMKVLAEGGYGGAVHLINPKRTEIEGRPCLASIDALPEGVDCAVLAIPQAGVMEALYACARRGVGGAVIFSAGFAEGGDEGRAAQEEIGRIAREAKMIVEGPNCLGFVNYIDNAIVTFVQSPAKQLVGRKGIGIVSQSGAMATVLSASLANRDAGLSYFVSTGNEAASGIDDYVDFLIGDEDTKVITLIVEQFRNPKRFLALAAEARKIGKPIVLLHPGRSAAARKSAETHTGAMAGDYQVMRTKVTHAGVCVVDSIEELLDVSELFLRCPLPPRGAGACVFAESGAFKALSLDFCEAIGLELPAISPATETALRAVLPDFIPPTNPMDLTAQSLVDRDLYRKTLAPFLADERFGSIAICIILTDAWTCDLKLPPIIDTLKALAPAKPVIFAGLDDGADIPKHYVGELRAMGVPFFPSSERVFRALKHFTDYAKRLAKPARGKMPAAPKVDIAPGVNAEYQAKRVLAAMGVPIPPGAFAKTLDEARAVARTVGYPLVLKAQSPDLSHKSDAGGVILNLADEAALVEGWARLYGNVKRAKPNLMLDGVLIEGMGKRGVELIVGARNDPDWGPVILVGFGGVLAEALHDVRLLAPDLSVDEIIEEFGRLKSAALLAGFRGSPPVDVKAVAEIVQKLGALMLARDDIVEVDINPVVGYEKGAIALDALIYAKG
jgi:acyl-CoA synthetase (NDP forming)